MAKPSKPVNLFTDGSYLGDTGIGGWAFHIPELKAKKAGVAEGVSSSYFELLSVLKGLEYLRTECPDRQVNLLCDCETLLRKWFRVIRGKRSGTLKNGVTYPESLKPLLEELNEVMPEDILLNHADSGQNKEHLVCHKLAGDAIKKQALKEYPQLALKWKQISPARYSAMLFRRQRLLDEISKLNQGIQSYENWMNELKVKK
jgi:ribonuclease HI